MGIWGGLFSERPGVLLWSQGWGADGVLPRVWVGKRWSSQVCSVLGSRILTASPGFPFLRLQPTDLSPDPPLPSREGERALEGWDCTGAELPVGSVGRKVKSRGSEPQTSRRGSSCWCPPACGWLAAAYTKNWTFCSAYKTCKLFLHRPPALGVFALWFPPSPTPLRSSSSRGRISCFF